MPLSETEPPMERRRGTSAVLSRRSFLRGAIAGAVCMACPQAAIDAPRRSHSSDDFVGPMQPPPLPEPRAFGALPENASIIGQPFILPIRNDDGTIDDVEAIFDSPTTLRVRDQRFALHTVAHDGDMYRIPAAKDIEHARLDIQRSEGLLLRSKQGTTHISCDALTRAVAALSAPRGKFTCVPDIRCTFRANIRVPIIGSSFSAPLPIPFTCTAYFEFVPSGRDGKNLTSCSREL